jgi:hypothetical protein
LKKNYFSSHKLPKQQSTSFWSQGILGVKFSYFIVLRNRFFQLCQKMQSLVRKIEGNLRINP